MPFNAAGLNDPSDVDSLSLHSANPGVGVSPVAGELAGAPYARQSVAFAAPVSGAFVFSAPVVFNLRTDIAQNVQFVGLWKGGVYKGYFIPDTPYNFTAAATSRSYTLQATSSINITNP